MPITPRDETPTLNLNSKEDIKTMEIAPPQFPLTKPFDARALQAFEDGPVFMHESCSCHDHTELFPRLLAFFSGIKEFVVAFWAMACLVFYGVSVVFKLLRRKGHYQRLRPTSVRATFVDAFGSMLAVFIGGVLCDIAMCGVAVAVAVWLARYMFSY